MLAKGPPKLKELPPDPNEDKNNDEPVGMANVATIAVVGNGVSVRYARGASFSVGDNRIEVTKLPLWVFCRNLERYSDRQIVDMTGLTGSYTFAVNVTPEDYQAMMLRSAVLRGAKLPPEAQTLLDASPPFAIGDALRAGGPEAGGAQSPARHYCYRQRPENPDSQLDGRTAPSRSRLGIDGRCRLRTLLSRDGEEAVLRARFC